MHPAPSSKRQKKSRPEAVAVVIDIATSGKPAKSHGTAAAGGKPAAAGLTGKSQKKKGEAVPLQAWWTADEVQQIQPSLLAWYDRVHRVLPWRRTPHSTRQTPAPAGAAPAPAELPQQRFAYFVWVSEIMLQQTQVATVIPYFQKWTARWPTVQDLALADVEEVNTMWAGLGYYRRARFLLEGAKYVVSELGGHFPENAKELQKVPGVGPYTSAAVASIAFGEPVAVVDGNVVRVMSRLRTLGGDPTKQAATHTAMAQQMLDGVDRPGDLNQAVMELGATVCKPVNPLCSECPISHSCRAYKAVQQYISDGQDPDLEDAPRVTDYPQKKERAEKREMSVAVCVLELVCRASSAVALAPASGPAIDAAASDATAASSNSAAAATTSVPSAVASAASQPAKRKARNMMDFVAAGRAKAALQAAEASGARTELGTDATQAVTAAREAAVLLERGARHHLLVQRPAEGLLAGLWEFPGVEFSGEKTYVQRQALVDAHLSRLLGATIVSSPATVKSIKNGSSRAADVSAGSSKSCLTVLSRHHVGEHIHVFSHIRQTNFVERLVVAVDDLTALMAAAGANCLPEPAANAAPLASTTGAASAAAAEATAFPAVASASTVGIASGTASAAACEAAGTACTISHVVMSSITTGATMADGAAAMLAGGDVGDGAADVVITAMIPTLNTSSKQVLNQAAAQMETTGSKAKIGKGKRKVVAGEAPQGSAGGQRAPALRLVSDKDMAGEGLTSGVRKIYKMACSA